MHPNDIRTLVRVVNMLGQEVNPEIEPRGNVLLYLYKWCNSIKEACRVSILKYQTKSW